MEQMQKTKTLSNVSRVISLIGLGAAFLGCNVCEDLDERVCADLGEADCTYWKSKEMNFTKTATGGRQKMLKSLIFGDGAETCRALGNDAAYSAMLEGTKQSLAAQRKADEATAKVGAAKTE